MYKEIIIIITILVLVFSLNYMTQKYTKFCVSEISSDLNNLRGKIEEKINSEEVSEELNNSINSIHNKWDEMYKKLAYYIEHDELEKVETCLTNIRSNIETEELEHSIENLDNCIFVLEHIKDKEQLSLANIF
ncbi:MAG: DUF4363 family protein [Clostridia bacterium]|nr:DUF4363 family protein [Clostridia bacterium]